MSRFADLSAVQAVVWNRAVTDSLGAAVRAKLGAGAASIILAADLRGGVDTLPARPLLALQPMPVASDGARDRCGFRWWIYDDPAAGEHRMAEIAPLLAASYDGERYPDRRLPAPAAAVIFGGLSDSRPDTALGLQRRSLDITVIA